MIHLTGLLVLLFYVLIISTDAIGDALNDMNKKKLGHSIIALSLLLWLIMPFVIDIDRSQFGWYIASYICLRFAIFDAIYNITRKLPIYYVGSSSFVDSFVYNTGGGRMWMFGRVIVLIAGVQIPLVHIF